MELRASTLFGERSASEAVSVGAHNVRLVVQRMGAIEGEADAVDGAIVTASSNRAKRGGAPSAVATQVYGGRFALPGLAPGLYRVFAAGVAEVEVLVSPGSTSNARLVSTESGVLRVAVTLENGAQVPGARCSILSGVTEHAALADDMGIAVLEPLRAPRRTFVICHKGDLAGTAVVELLPGKPCESRVTLVEAAGDLGLAFELSRDGSIVVSDVDAADAAAAIRPGDRIARVDGVEVAGNVILAMKHLSLRPFGSYVDLNVVSDSGAHSVRLEATRPVDY